MADFPIANQGKTKFVEEYLATHGDTRRPAINEAWQAAGHDGEISESLVSKLRAKQGLTLGRGASSDSHEADDEDGDSHDEVMNPVVRRRGRPRKEVVDSSAPDDSLSGSKSGKSAFVANLLTENPEVKIREVNEAWVGAGHDDSISSPTFYKVKARLAASGSAEVAFAHRVGATATPRAETRSQLDRTSKSSPTVSGHSHGERHVVDEVEAGIDDLMFRLKTSGGMPEVEATLRAARRQLYSNGKN